MYKFAHESILMKKTKKVKSVKTVSKTKVAKTETLTPEEAKLMNAKTPEKYIELSLQAKLTSGQKASVTRKWLSKTGFSNGDIKKARHRNNYWKEQKIKGSEVRNIIRWSDHDYSGGKRKTWTEADVSKFIDANGMKDWELAKKFKCTIPSIQARRRSINATKKILEKQRKKVIKANILKLALKSDKYLMNLLKTMK